MPGVVGIKNTAKRSKRCAKPGSTPVVQEEETRNEAKIGLVTRQAPSGGGPS